MSAIGVCIGGLWARNIRSFNISSTLLLIWNACKGQTLFWHPYRPPPVQSLPLEAVGSRVSKSIETTSFQNNHPVGSIAVKGLFSKSIHNTLGIDLINLI